MQTPKANTLDKPAHYVFLLLNEFSQACFTCAVESLRQGNRATEKPSYSWSVAVETGDSISGSNGIEMKTDMNLDEVHHDDTIVVCGGLNIKKNTTQAVLNWLRRESRKGIKIAGISTGAYTLAKAGLLDEKRCTIHWENHDSFEEDFPEIDLQKSVYVIDGKRLTCAGGTSSIDLFLKIIAGDHGQDAANWVSDQLIYNSPRTEKDGQRLSIPTRIGVRHPKLGGCGEKDGKQYRRSDFSVPIGETGRCFYPSIGTVVSAVFEPFAKAVLYGIALAKGAAFIDANGYDGDKCGIGVWVCLALAFFQMLSRAV